MPNNDFAQRSQYEFLFDALAQKYPGLADVNESTFFQFAQAPVAARWISGNDIEAYDIANSVPGNLGGFWVAAGPFDAAYASLLRSIQPKEGDTNDDYVAIQRKLVDQESVYDVTAKDANADYFTWLANNPGPNGTASASKNAWLQDPLGGKGWGEKLDTIQAKIDEYTSELAKILGAMDGALSAAMARLGTDNMPVSNGGPARQVASLRIDGNLTDDKARWDSYHAGEFDFDVIINAQAEIKSPWRTVYTTEVHHDCWSTSTSVNVNTSRMIADEKYQLRVRAVGLEAYHISRGGWYDQTFVNPKQKIVQGSAGVTNDSFFGLQGSLHMIPETIVVLYKPTLQLTISTDMYKEQFEANADASVNWLDLFSFRFNVDGLASLQPVEGGETTTVTFASPDNAIPQILGVSSTSAFNGNTQ